MLALGLVFTQMVGVVNAQDKPKNEITKIEKARKEDHTTKQVTVDPKKSPGKHADNLSKNVNRDANRNSKNVNNGIKKGANDLHKARKDDHTTKQVTVDPKKSPGKHADNLSKNVNRDANRNSKNVNNGIKKGTNDLHQARKDDHTTKQVTVDPKKSPGKHADNLSKNVNHEANRISKDVNHIFSGHKKKDTEKKPEEKKN